MLFGILYIVLCLAFSFILSYWFRKLECKYRLNKYSKGKLLRKKCPYVKCKIYSQCCAAQSTVDNVKG